MDADTHQLQPFYLGMANIFHKVTLQRDGQNIEVKRYHRKMRATFHPVSYSYNIWVIFKKKLNLNLNFVFFLN